MKLRWYGILWDLYMDESTKFYHRFKILKMDFFRFQNLLRCKMFNKIYIQFLIYDLQIKNLRFNQLKFLCIQQEKKDIFVVYFERQFCFKTRVSYTP